MTYEHKRIPNDREHEATFQRKLSSPSPSGCRSPVAIEPTGQTYLAASPDFKQNRLAKFEFVVWSSSSNVLFSKRKETPRFSRDDSQVSLI